VEITEATSRSYEKFKVIAVREFKEFWFDPGHFRPGSPVLTTNQMRNLAQAESLTSDGWQGYEAEKEWAEFISSAIRRKARKLAGKSFAKHARIWLSIYANLPLPAGLNYDVAVRNLEPFLEEHWGHTVSFDSIFVEEGRSLFAFSRSAHDRLRLIDLWAQARDR
jgi:hypothetical protein